MTAMTDPRASEIAVNVETIAFVLMLYELDNDGDWPDDLVRQALEYRDTEHCGDCTGQPFTCMRCVSDDVYVRANAIAAALTKGPTNG